MSEAISQFLQQFVLPYLVSTGLLFGIAYFFRDALRLWLTAKTKSIYDEKLETLKSVHTRQIEELKSGFAKELETLKADLSRSGKEVEALRAAPLGARAVRQANIDKRRLEATDQLWSAVKIMQPGRAAASWMSVINWEAAADATKRDPKAQDLFRVFAELTDIHKHDAHAAQPYVSPLAAALFSAYSSGIGLIQARMAVLQTGVGKEALNSPEPIFKLLIEALPDQKEYIEKFGAAGMPYILTEIEKRLLAELKRTLEGVDDDRSQVEHAARITALAKEAERNMNVRPVPAEFRTGAAASPIS
ncbi:hypothetical protein [Rhizobium mongolense]|uniref:hypothetical protein n=1 Tax=Rhizobium mongolense TaxID=57676 RepID=UPI0034A0FA6D